MLWKERAELTVEQIVQLTGVSFSGKALTNLEILLENQFKDAEQSALNKERSSPPPKDIKRYRKKDPLDKEFVEEKFAKIFYSLPSNHKSYIKAKSVELQWKNNGNITINQVRMLNNIIEEYVDV